MKIDDLAISKTIINSYMRKLLGSLQAGAWSCLEKNRRADLPGGQRWIAIDIIVSVEALLCAFRRTWLGHNPV
jgi:hypothetical protein